MLYVGEGDNKDRRLIRLANSRPEIHTIFIRFLAVSYTHLRAHETVLDLVCRLLLEKKKQYTKSEIYYVKYLKREYNSR